MQFTTYHTPISGIKLSHKSEAENFRKTVFIIYSKLRHIIGHTLVLYGSVCGAVCLEYEVFLRIYLVRMRWKRKPQLLPLFFGACDCIYVRFFANSLVVCSGCTQNLLLPLCIFIMIKKKRVHFHKYI